MPAKNAIKLYDENGYYHIYNRGVEKRDIFLDEQDYGVFLSYLKFYLSKRREDEICSPSKILNNYSSELDLLCYCLMPNHFHLLIRQHTLMAMTNLIRSLMTRYSMYFNRKYVRVGGLFQGRYKAVQVHSEDQLTYLSHYIHRNPQPAGSVLAGLLDYKYSSLGNYLGYFSQEWVKPQEIVGLFSLSNPKLTYLSFITHSEVDPDDSLTLDLLAGSVLAGALL